MSYVSNHPRLQNPWPMQEQASRRRFCYTTLEKHECILVIRCPAVSLFPFVLLLPGAGVAYFLAAAWTQVYQALHWLCCVCCHCSSSSVLPHHKKTFYLLSFLIERKKSISCKVKLPEGDEAGVELIKSTADSSVTRMLTLEILQSSSHSSSLEHIQTFKLLILFPSWAPMGASWKIPFSLFTVSIKYDTLIQEEKEIISNLKWSSQNFTALLSLYINKQMILIIIIMIKE